MTSLNSLWTLFIAILAILNCFTIFEQKRVEKQFSSRTGPHSCPRLLLYKSRLLQEVTGKVYARAVTWVERPVPRGCSLGCSPCFSWVPVAVNVCGRSEDFLLEGRVIWFFRGKWRGFSSRQKTATMENWLVINCQWRGDHNHYRDYAWQLLCHFLRLWQLFAVLATSSNFWAKHRFRARIKRKKFNDFQWKTDT